MTTIPKDKSIPERIYKALASGSDKYALKVQGKDYTYSQLRDAVFSFAASLQEMKASRVALYTAATFQTYQSLLGTLLTGITCVPLNPLFPPLRNAFIIDHSDSTHIFIDYECVDSALDTFINHMSEEQLSHLALFTMPDTVRVIDTWGSDRELSAELNRKLAIVKSRLTAVPYTAYSHDICPEVELPEVDSEEIMHILYTSGTTGNPKGAMITQGNYAAYLDKILNMYQFSSSDVFTHYSVITFDMSLQDPLCSIISGGKLVCPTERDRTVPHRYLSDNDITVVHFVPSAITYMHRIGVLKKLCNDRVRLAIFIGEPFWSQLARQFHKAFPVARIINAYGPTEATVAVSVYELSQEELCGDGRENYIVPVGCPLPGVDFAIADINGNPVSTGEVGELYIGGDQVALGYHKSNVEGAFFERDGKRWYKTGDMVRSSVETASCDCLHAKASESFTCLHFLGRNDDTVKVGSARVSLLEVEEKLALLTPAPVKAVICSERYDGIDYNVIAVAFENIDHSALESVKMRIGEVLPKYMYPRYMTTVPVFPLNVNQKVDRKALKEMILGNAASDPTLSVLS